MFRLLPLLSWFTGSRPVQNRGFIPQDVIDEELDKYCKIQHDEDGRPLPISEVDFQHITELLRNLEAYAHISGWSRRPRTYTVLRNIRCLDLFPYFINHNLSDYSLPYTTETLPPEVADEAKREMFLRVQEAVLTPTKELEAGPEGRHVRFLGSADDFFHVRRPLGEGAFSYVEEVSSKLSLKLYARKSYRRGRDTLRNRRRHQAFEEEFLMLRRFSHHHRHLVKFIGSYTDKSYIAFLMLPVADGNLMEFLMRPDDPRDDRLSRLRSFYGCISNALNYLHTVALIRHRDLKPENILIKDNKIYLTDFGAALDWSASGHSVTQDPFSARTERYMAPEVANNQIKSSATDMWCLGVVFLEMTTVLRGRTIEEMRRYLDNKFVFSDLPTAHKWLGILRKSKIGSATDNEPLIWIKDLIQEAPEKRPNANSLWMQIMVSSYSKQFCGACCHDDYRENMASQDTTIYSHTEVATFKRDVDDFETIRSSNLVPGNGIIQPGRKQTILDWMRDSIQPHPEASRTPSPSPIVRDFRSSPSGDHWPPTTTSRSYMMPGSFPEFSDDEGDHTDHYNADPVFAYEEEPEEEDGEEEAGGLGYEVYEDSSESELTARPDPATSFQSLPRTDLTGSVNPAEDPIQRSNPYRTTVTSEDTQNAQEILERLNMIDGDDSDDAATEKPISSHLAYTQEVPAATLYQPNQFIIVRPPSQNISSASRNEVASMQFPRPPQMHALTSTHIPPHPYVESHGVVQSEKLPELQSSLGEPEQWENPWIDQVVGQEQVIAPPPIRFPQPSIAEFIPEQVQPNQFLEIPGIRYNQQAETNEPAITNGSQVTETSQIAHNDDQSRNAGSQVSNRVAGDVSKGKGTKQVEIRRVKFSDGVNNEQKASGAQNNDPMTKEPKRSILSNTGKQSINDSLAHGMSKQEGKSGVNQYNHANTKYKIPITQERKEVNESWASKVDESETKKASDERPYVPSSNRLTEANLKASSSKISAHELAETNKSRVSKVDKNETKKASDTKPEVPSSSSRLTEANLKVSGPKTPTKMTASVYMKNVFEASSTIATSVMSENTAKLFKQKGALLKWFDQDYHYLEHYCKAGKAAAVQYLLEIGCNPGTEKKRRPKPLIYAIKGGTRRHTKCVRQLLEHGANVNISLSGKTALHYAIELKNFKGFNKLLLNLLNHNANPNIPDNNGDYPLLKVLYGSYEPLQEHEHDMLALLLQSKFETNVNISPRGTLNMPLHLAIRRTDPLAVGMLLAKGAKVNEPNASGTKPLALAALAWKAPVTAQKIEILELLLESKANVHDLSGPSKRTPLHLAVLWGSLQAVELLLHHGANPNMEDNDGNDPINLAESHHFDDITRVLLRHRDVLRAKSSQ
ncbi:MAG: hypothetical protein M1834_009739 [Cirrosporium novae-zelandiae]|nr:MAG: hypothetical protein M1834_009739 [Cirrosporium novae-zelandiae]